MSGLCRLLSPVPARPPASEEEGREERRKSLEWGPAEDLGADIVEGVRRQGEKRAAPDRLGRNAENHADVTALGLL